MRKILVLLLANLVVFPLGAGQRSKAERKNLEAWAKSLDKEQIHTMVTAAENDPLGEMAENARPVLAVYFEDVDYDVCLDQFQPLLHSKDKLHEYIWMQVVFSSGDFVIRNPEKSKDRYTYMLAGLEGALRAYEHILERHSKARLVFLDDLIALRNAGRLGEHVRAHMCK